MAPFDTPEDELEDHEPEAALQAEEPGQESEPDEQAEDSTPSDLETDGSIVDEEDGIDPFGITLADWEDSYEQNDLFAGAGGSEDGEPPDNWAVGGSDSFFSSGSDVLNFEQEGNQEAFDQGLGDLTDEVGESDDDNLYTNQDKQMLGRDPDSELLNFNTTQEDAGNFGVAEEPDAFLGGLGEANDEELFGSMVPDDEPDTPMDAIGSSEADILQGILNGSVGSGDVPVLLFDDEAGGQSQLVQGQLDQSLTKIGQGSMAELEAPNADEDQVETRVASGSPRAQAEASEEAQDHQPPEVEGQEVDDQNEAQAEESGATLEEPSAASTEEQLVDQIALAESGVLGVMSSDRVRDFDMAALPVLTGEGEFVGTPTLNTEGSLEARQTQQETGVHPSSNPGEALIAGTISRSHTAINSVPDILPSMLPEAVPDASRIGGPETLAQAATTAVPRPEVDYVPNPALNPNIPDMAYIPDESEREAFDRTLALDPNNIRHNPLSEQYTSVLARSEYYKDISTALKDCPGTRGIRFFDVIGEVTGPLGVGVQETLAGPYLQIPTQVMSNLHNLNGKILDHLAPVIRGVLINGCPVDPRNPSKPLNVSPQEFDRRLVHFEQSNVEKMLNSLPEKDRNELIDYVNRTLNGANVGGVLSSLSAIVPGNAQDINQAKRDLGLDKLPFPHNQIDFRNQKHREAIGFAKVRRAHLQPSSR